MLREIHFISNRAMMLGSGLLMGIGIMLGFRPEIAHEWLALGMGLDVDFLMPVTKWSSVAWRGLVVIGGLYAVGTMPPLLTLVWKLLGRMQKKSDPGRANLDALGEAPGTGE